MATRIFLSSVVAFPPVVICSVPVVRGWHRFVFVTVLASRTVTLDGIIVALMSKAKTTDGGDGVHIEADLSVWRLGGLGQVNGWLHRNIRRRQGQWRPGADSGRWRRRRPPMENGSVAASDKIFASLIKFCPVT